MVLREVLDNPLRRVFHIAPECYIIFGGLSNKDREFFIRIGNYPDIPAIVLQKTSAIACPATPLGDIFCELEHSAQHTREVFTGLPRIVRKYKTLFGYSTIQATKYESVASDKPEQGVYIHYTGDEELDVRLNNKPFFSLSTRAKQDQHYQTVVSNAYTVVRRMRMANGPKQVAQHGFYMLDGAVYAYNKQAVLALGADPNFVMAHAARGFDPKIVQSAYFVDARSLALYRFLMHANKHQLNGAILFGQSDDIDIVRRICSFVGYPYKHTVSPPYHKIPFQELIIDVADSPKIIKIFGPHNIKISINPSKKQWKATSGPENGGDALHEGLLYGWDLSKKYSWSELRRGFLPSAFDAGTHNIARSEREFLTNGLRVIDSTAQPLLKNALRRLKMLQKKCTKQPSRFFMFALGNINHVASLALNSRSKRAGSYSLLKKALSIIQSTYNAVQSGSIKRDSGISIFPGMSALLVLTDDGIRCLIDYKWNRDARYALHDQEQCKKIADFVSAPDEKYHASELARLYALFDGLEGKQRAPKRVAKSSSGATDNAVGGGAEGEADQSAERPHKRKGGSRKAGVQSSLLRRLIVGGVVLLVLVGALIGLEFLGVLNISDSIRATILQDEDAVDQSERGVTDGTTSQQEQQQQETQQEEQQALDEQKSEQLEQEQSQQNDGNDGNVSATETDSALSEFDINVLRNAVADGTNLSSPWIILSTPLGTVNITVGEIIATTNAIAINSGFRTLGDDSGDGPDPDLIYPEGILRLPPDTTQYNIVLNDTMWGVAENLIIEQVKDHIGTLATINQQLDNAPDSVDVTSTTAILRQIIERSYCADVIAIANSLLNRL